MDMLVTAAKRIKYSNPDEEHNTETVAPETGAPPPAVEAPLVASGGAGELRWSRFRPRSAPSPDGFGTVVITPVVHNQGVASSDVSRSDHDSFR